MRKLVVLIAANSATNPYSLVGEATTAALVECAACMREVVSEASFTGVTEGVTGFVASGSSFRFLFETKMKGETK